MECQRSESKKAHFKIGSLRELKPQWGALSGQREAISVDRNNCKIHAGPSSSIAVLTTVLKSYPQIIIFSNVTSGFGSLSLLY